MYTYYASCMVHIDRFTPCKQHHNSCTINYYDYWHWLCLFIPTTLRKYTSACIGLYSLHKLLGVMLLTAVIVHTNCSVQFCSCAAPVTFVSPCWGIAMTFWSKACVYSISLPCTRCGPWEGAWPVLMYVILPSNSPSLCAGVTWCCIRGCKLGHEFDQ